MNGTLKIEGEDIYTTCQRRVAEESQENKEKDAKKSLFNATLETEAGSLGLLPETYSTPPPELTDEEKEKILARAAMARELMRQSRDRNNKRGKNVKIKNGKSGRMVGMWFSFETLDALNELSLSWEISRTSVVTQLIRQNKGAVLRKWIGPVEGEEEKKPKLVAPEDNKRLMGRKL